MELKPTQKQVLKVLVDHREEWLGREDIYKECKVNRNNIDSAIKFFMNNDYVHQPNIEGKVIVSLDGIDLYYRNI